MVVDRLRRNAETMERRVVEPELATYRERALAQFDVVLEYVESDAPFEAFRTPCSNMTATSRRSRTERLRRAFRS